MAPSRQLPGGWHTASAILNGKRAIHIRRSVAKRIACSLSKAKISSAKSIELAAIPHPMLDHKIGPVRDRLAQLEQILEGREEGVTFHVSLDHGKIEIGASRQGLLINVSATAYEEIGSLSRGIDFGKVSRYSNPGI